MESKGSNFYSAIVQSIYAHGTIPELKNKIPKHFKIILPDDFIGI